MPLKVTPSEGMIASFVVIAKNSINSFNSKNSTICFTVSAVVGEIVQHWTNVAI
jgi:hypothetical protein